MMKLNRRGRALTWTIGVAVFSMALAAFGSLTYAQQTGHAPAEGAAEGYLATIAFVSGAVGVWREGATEWTMVEPPYDLYMGDHVRTGADARAVIVFTDASELLMHEQTTVQITPREPVEEPRGVAARIKVSLGKVFNRVTPGQSDLEFETPDAVAAVRGTEFLVSTGPDGRINIAVLGGMVDAMLEQTLTDEELVDFLGGYLDLEGAADASEAWLQELIDALIAEVEQSSRVSEASLRDAGEAATDQALEARQQQQLEELRQRQRQRAEESRQQQQQRREELFQKLAQRGQERADEQEQQRSEEEQQERAEEQQRREQQQPVRDRIEQLAQERAQERTAAEPQSPETEPRPGDPPDEGGVGDHLTRVDFAEIVARLMEAEGVRESGTSPALDWAAEFIERQVDRGHVDEFGSHAPGPWTFEQLAQLVADLGLDAETLVQVLSGQVDVFNALGLTAVEAGQQTQVPAGEAPADATEMTDEERQAALEWVDELDEQREAAAATADAGEDTDDPDGVPGLAFIPTARPSGSVTGQLLRRDVPAIGVGVILAEGENAEETEVFRHVRTDANGNYTFTDVPSGDYYVTVLNDLMNVGDDWAPFSDLPGPMRGPAVGDLFAAGIPVVVADEAVDVGPFDLTIGHDAVFLLTLNDSGRSEPIDGGADFGADTFVLAMDDVVGPGNPLLVKWTFGGLYSDYLIDAVVLEVLVVHEGQLDVDGEFAFPRGEDDTVAITSLEAANTPVRLLLHLESRSGASVMFYGPRVEYRGDPTLNELHPARVMASSDSFITLKGQYLHDVEHVYYWNSEHSGSWTVFSHTPDGTEITVQLAADGVEPGLFQLGVDDIGAETGLKLLITSTDLSGGGPGVTLPRGDLHRSGRGDGPVGEAESLQAVLWNQLDQVEDWWGSGPAFLGDFMVISTESQGFLDILPLTGGQPDRLDSWYAFTMAGSPTWGPFVYHVSEGGLASFAPDNPQQVVIHNEAAEFYSDFLVHDGVLVALGENGLVTYDAREHSTVFTNIQLPGNPQSEYFLGISSGAGPDNVPLLHLVGSESIWTGELYTLEERWSSTEMDEGFDVLDSAVSPDGAVLYVVDSNWEDELRVRAYDTRSPVVWERGRKDVSTELPEGWQPIPNSLAVHRDGWLFMLVAVYPDQDSQFIIYGVILSADLESVVMIEGAKLPEGVEMLQGGLVLADTAEYAYGYVTPQGEESVLFRIHSDPQTPPASAWETLQFSTIDRNVNGIAAARGSLWVVDDWGRIYQISSAADFGTLSLPDPPLVKRADKANAQIGDIITYTITFDNTKLIDDETDLVDHTNVWIQDVLPPGFVFVEGSSYVYPPGGAAPVALAPAGSSGGRTLQFELTDADAGGIIPRETQRTLTYQAIVGPRVVEGATYSNTAIGYYDGPNTVRGRLELDNLCTDPVQDLPTPLPQDCDHILTNVARADVRVRPGVFTMRGLVLGKVFYDYDGDGLQGPGEPGIPGARIVMETGVSVVADPFGKFSLSNLTPGLHVFMLDETSLPESESVGPRILGGKHRLVDLAGGGLFTVNFAVQAALPEDESTAEVE